MEAVLKRWTASNGGSRLNGKLSNLKMVLWRVMGAKKAPSHRPDQSSLPRPRWCTGTSMAMVRCTGTAIVVIHTTTAAITAAIIGGTSTATHIAVTATVIVVTVVIVIVIVMVTVAVMATSRTTPTETAPTLLPLQQAATYRPRHKLLHMWVPWQSLHTTTWAPWLPFLSSFPFRQRHFPPASFNKHCARWQNAFPCFVMRWLAMKRCVSSCAKMFRGRMLVLHVCGRDYVLFVRPCCNGCWVTERALLTVLFGCCLCLVLFRA